MFQMPRTALQRLDSVCWVTCKHPDPTTAKYQPKVVQQRLSLQGTINTHQQIRMQR